MARRCNWGGRAFPTSAKLINPKYSKHWPYLLANKIDCVWFSLFWTQKIYLEYKISSFLTFVYINFLLRTLYCTETLFTCFVHKNMKETTLESRLLYKKMQKFPVLAWGPNLPPQKTKSSIWVFIVLGIYNITLPQP